VVVHVSPSTRTVGPQTVLACDTFKTGKNDFSTQRVIGASVPHDTLGKGHCCTQSSPRIRGWRDGSCCHQDFKLISTEGSQPVVRARQRLSQAGYISGKASHLHMDFVSKDQDPA